MKLRPLIGRLLIALLSIVVWDAVCVVSIVASEAVTVTLSVFVETRSLKSTVGAEPRVMTTFGSLCLVKPWSEAVTA